MTTEPKLGVPVQNPGALLRVFKPAKARLAHAAGPADTFDLVGGTMHVQVWVARTLPVGARTLGSAVFDAVEKDYLRLKDLFRPLVAYPDVRLYVSDLSGAYDGSGGAEHYGCDGPDLYVDYAAGRPDRVLALGLAELSEVFQAAAGTGWNCGWSNGEGLSRFHAELFYPGVLDDYATAWKWLDGPRSNWIDSPASTDGSDDANGCSVLFLWWLANQGWGAEDITQAAGSSLAQVYRDLVGNLGGWTVFKAAVDAAWPPGKPSGVTTDDAWHALVPHAPDPETPPDPEPEPEPTPEPIPEPIPDPTPTPSIPVLPLQASFPSGVAPGNYTLVPASSQMKRLLGTGLPWLTIIEIAATLAETIIGALGKQPATQPAAPTVPGSSGS